MNGLQRELDTQIKKNKVSGGVSRALGRAKARPAGNYHSSAVRNNIRFEPCDECGNQAEYASIMNGESEYQLCRECFNKREKK